MLVLDKGRQVYFGPPSEARAYFEGLGFKSLPRQSTPDYLTGCTDPNERQFAPGRSELDVPSSPNALEAAFQKSRFAGDMRDELEKYKQKMGVDRTDQEAFRKAVLADKKRGVSKKSPYTLGFTGQVKALFIRQFRMRLQDRFQLITSFSLSTVREGGLFGHAARADSALDFGLHDWCRVLQPPTHVARRVHARVGRVRRPPHVCPRHVR